MRRHLLHQGPVIRSLLKTGLTAGGGRGATPELPGPLLQQTVAPPPGALVDDYLRWAGAPRDRTLLPAHLFSQWGFPLLTRSLQAVPYDLRKALNGGVRVEVHEPLRRGEKLLLEAQLESIDDNGSRAILHNRLTTRTARGGHVDAWMRVFVPLAKKKRTGPRKPKPRVPDQARPLAERRMKARDAQRFVYLTGDVNPVHWSPVYARAAGFPNTILHGFATLAWAWEALVSARFAGDRTALHAVDVTFVKPVVLPTTVRLFDHGPQLAVGSAPGGPAFLVGSLETA